MKEKMNHISRETISEQEDWKIEMVKRQKRLKSKYWCAGLLVFRNFRVDGKNRKLIIPVELTEEQYIRINKSDELERIREWERFSVFSEKVEKIMQKTIKQQVRLWKRRFRRHPDKWVELAKPIKINDKEIELYLAIVKMQRLGSNYSIK